VAAGLQCLDEAQFLLGRDSGENGGALGRVGELLVVEFFQIAAGESDDVRTAGQADLPGDGFGGEDVVAGDHLHADPGGPALRHGINRLRARRVELALEVEKSEFCATCSWSRSVWSEGISRRAKASMRKPRAAIS
jgi:hypothetical protein